MKPVTILAALSALTFISQFALAAPQPLSVELVEAKGNGCPAGSISSSITSDGSALSVLFSQFTAQSSSESDPRQKSICNLILKIRMAPGFGVGIVNADYRGFAALSGPHSRAVFRSSWVLRDDGKKVANGPNLNETFQAGYNDVFYVRQATPDVQWIGCNDRQAKLVLQSSITAVAKKGSEAFITVDSSDVASEMKFFLSVRPCEGQPLPTQPVKPKPPVAQASRCLGMYSFYNEMFGTTANITARQGPGTSVMVGVTSPEYGYQEVFGTCINDSVGANLYFKIGEYQQHIRTVANSAVLFAPALNMQGTHGTKSP